MGTIGRLQLSAGTLGVIAAAILMSLGHTELVLPMLGGVLWGMANIYILRRLTEHIRPDRPRRPALIALDIILKLAMLALGFALLYGRPVPQILTAAIGFTIILFVMFLRSLGQVFAKQPENSGTVGGE